MATNSFIPYTPSSKAWSNIQGQAYGNKFYPLQSGHGTQIKMVSPAEGALQRAKLDLKRQLDDAAPHSSPSKRRRSIKVLQKKKKKIKKKLVNKKKKKVTKKKKKKASKKSSKKKKN